MVHLITHMEIFASGDDAQLPQTSSPNFQLFSIFKQTYCKEPTSDGLQLESESGVWEYSPKAQLLRLFSRQSDCAEST